MSLFCVHLCLVVLVVAPGANEELAIRDFKDKGLTKMASGRLEVSLSLADK